LIKKIKIRNNRYFSITMIFFSNAILDHKFVWQYCLNEHYITSAIGITLIFIGIIVTFAVRRSNAPASAKVYVTERI